MYTYPRCALAGSPTLPSSKSITPENLAVLRELRKKVVTGVVGGSDFVKVSEQLSIGGSNGASPYYKLYTGVIA